MKIHLVSGFLGSGKTTVIRTAAKLMMGSGVTTGVITNDQGIRLVDGGYLAAAGIPGRQVMNGCFCCNYSDLDRQISSLILSDRPETIFAESVGSCTDIVATVFKPLRAYRPEALTTFTTVCDGLLLKMLLLQKQRIFEPEVEYIYWKQIEEATLLLLNKTDLLQQPEILQIRQEIENRFGKKTILPVQGNSRESAAAWLALLNRAVIVPGASPELNYDIYGAGEAMMGWLDMDIRVETDKPVAATVAARLVERISRRIRTGAYPVGHIKWLIDDREKMSETAIGIPSPFPDLPAAQQVKLLLNARVQVLPETLTKMVTESMAAVAAETGAEISTVSHSSFQPGYPRPEHRMLQ